MKKMIAGIFLGAFVLSLAGCGNNNANTTPQVPAASPQNSTSSTDNTKSADTAQGNVPQNLPPATGKVDDTANAIVSGANSEGAQATSTDADAQAAVGDNQDTNNLNSTYDQNAL